MSKVSGTACSGLVIKHWDKMHWEDGQLNNSFFGNIDISKGFSCLLIVVLHVKEEKQAPVSMLGQDIRPVQFLTLDRRTNSNT